MTVLLRDPNLLILRAHSGQGRQGGQEQGVQMRLVPRPEPMPQGVVRAEVTGRTADGRSQLTLADGRKLTADIQPPPATGSKITFSVKPDGSVVVRDLLPPPGQTSAGQPPPSGGPSTAKSAPASQASGQTTATAGQTSAGGSNVPVGQPAAAATARIVALFAELAGQSVSLTPPRGTPLPATGTQLSTQLAPATGSAGNNLAAAANGQQTFTLTPLPPAPAPAGGPVNPAPVTAPLQASLPQGLPSQTQLTLVITGQGQARIISLTPPHAAPAQVASTQQAAAPAAGSSAGSPQPGQTATGQAVPLSGAAPSSTPPPSQGLPPGVLLPLPTAGQSLPPAGTVATGQFVVSTSAAGQAVESAVQLDSGVRIPVASAAGQPPQGATVTIRLTADGLVEVLRMVPTDRVHARQGADNNSQQSSQHSTDSRQTEGRLPARPAPASPPLSPGSTHTGVITAQADKGMHAFSLPDGRAYEVQAGRYLPVGARITVNITADGHARIMDIQLPSSTIKTDTLARLSVRWPGLEQALTALKQDNPAQAEQLANRLPRPDGSFLPSMLAFAEAVGRESLERIAGKDTLNLLRALGIDLRADLQGLHQVARPEGNPDGWRGLLFPYMEHPEDAPRQGSLFWRHQDTTGGGTDERHVRFVVNLALSNLGPLQLDGLMHQRTLNLKLRMHETPDDTFVSGLARVVHQTLDGLGLAGSIEVETTDYFDVDPLHDLLKAPGQVNVTI